MNEFEDITLKDIDVWVLNEIKKKKIDFFINFYNCLDIQHNQYEEKIEIVNMYFNLYINNHSSFQNSKKFYKFFHSNQEFDVTIEKIDDPIDTLVPIQLFEESKDDLQKSLNHYNNALMIILVLVQYTKTPENLNSIIKIVKMIDTNNPIKSRIYNELLVNDFFVKYLVISKYWNDFTNKSFMCEFIKTTTQRDFNTLIKNQAIFRWFELLFNHNVVKFQTNYHLTQDKNLTDDLILLKLSKLMLKTFDQNTQKYNIIIKNFLYIPESNFNISTLDKFDERKSNEMYDNHYPLESDKSTSYSRFFYISHFLLYISMFHIKQRIEQCKKTIKGLDIMIQDLNANDNNVYNFINLYEMVQKLESKKSDINNEISIYFDELNDSVYNVTIRKFYDFTIQWIRCNMDEFSTLPICMVKTMLRYFYDLNDFRPLNIFYKFCEYLLLNKEYLNNNFEIFCLLNKCFIEQMMKNTKRYNINIHFPLLINNYIKFIQYKNEESYFCRHLIVKLITLFPKSFDSISFISLKEIYLDVVDTIIYLIKEITLDIDYLNKINYNTTKTNSFIEVKVKYFNTFIYFLFLISSITNSNSEGFYKKCINDDKISQKFYEMFVYTYSTIFKDSFFVYTTDQDIDDMKILDIKFKYDLNLDEYFYKLLLICLSSDNIKSIFKQDKDIPKMLKDMIMMCHALNIDQTIQLNELIENISKDQEIPEELLDPITELLINDPIILPDSNVLMDRKTIERHFETSKTDPYTRTPLDLEAIDKYNSSGEIFKKLTEIKNQINEFQ